MAAIVDGTDPADAWRKGATLLIETPDHIVRNLVTEIENPTAIDHAWARRFDPKSVGAPDRLSVVAKVLFPERPRLATETRQDYYDRWSTVLDRARATGRLHSSWGGTYFQRLISLDGSENQIERAIHVLRTWQNRSETAIVAHLSSPTLDGLRPRGSPCLQYVELLWRANNVIDLVAVYRNHDFLNKALGNFIGLARLLKFVASEADKQVGRVVCHSVRAYTDSVGRLTALAAR